MKTLANPYAVPSTFTVQVKACCGVLLGEICDCAGIPPKVTPPARQTIEYYALVAGRLQKVEAPAT